jgi:hypothetical protein
MIIASLILLAYVASRSAVVQTRDVSIFQLGLLERSSRKEYALRAAQLPL